ncbi:MAG: hypothetical protein WBA46_01745 [Thermomicrobiales bacterium]
MANRTLQRITDLPDGLVIPGLPEKLRTVPLDADEWLEWRDRVIRYRDHIRKQADVDERVRKAVLHLAANDPAYFCCIFGLIFEPRWKGDTPPGWRPWIPFPFQVETLRWIMDLGTKTGPRRHGVIEKARDMGASWMCCLVAVHFFLFADAGSVGFSSRSQDEVDVRGNPKSLFTKLRGLLTLDGNGVEAKDRLPDWLFPAGWSNRTHDKAMLLTHPSKPVSISGATTTKNTARGDRTTWWFNDEAAFNPYYGVSRASQVSVADHIISVSSAGMDDGGSFKAEAEQAALAKTNPDLPGSSYIRLDWFLNPLHDQQWYQDKKAEMNDDYAFAREIEIDYMAGQGDWVYPRSHRIEAGDYPYDATGGTLYCAIDPGLRDPTAIAYGQYNPHTGRTRWVKAILVNGMDARFVASLLVGVPISGEGGYSHHDYAPYLDFMAWTKSLRTSIEYVGDPFGSHRGADGSRTFYQALMEESHALTQGKHSIIVLSDFDKQSQTFTRRLESLNKALPQMDFDRDAEPLLVAIQQSRYPEQKDASMFEPLKPRHDSWSHFRSAAEFYAVHIDLFTTLSTTPLSRQPLIVNQGGERIERPTLPPRAPVPTRSPGFQLTDIRTELH